MAVDVGKSPPAASLSKKGDGRWDCREVEMDYPQLADSLQQLLGTEVAQPCPRGTESVAMSGGLAAAVPQGGLAYHQGVSSASPPARARGSLSETEVLVPGAAAAAEPRRVGHRFLASEEQQQLKAAGCWSPVSSPRSQQSSAEENILAGSHHDARSDQQSHRLQAQSPLSSSPELLQLQSLPSPESTQRSHSASCFSSLSSAENNLSQEPSQSLLASVDVPSPVTTSTTTTQELGCGWPVAEGRVLHKPFTPLLDDPTSMEHIRKMSPYQADYWACAIPDSLPPSPDRRSPHWDPNQEYEDLLDYAYPLKPRYKLGKMPEPFLHDSGIGLDSFSVSPEGTLWSSSIYGRGGQAWGSRENGSRRFVASAERFSTPKAGRTGSCYEPLPMAKEFSFTQSDSSHPSRGFARDARMESAGLGSSAAAGRSWGARGSPFPSSKGQGKNTKRFLPTTGVLPLRKEWEGDEEFLSLPPRLLELEGLAQFLSSLSLTVRTPGHDHGSLPRHRQPLPAWEGAGGRDKRRNSEDYAGLWHSCSSAKPSWEDTQSCSHIPRDPLQRLHLPAGLRDTLDGTYLNEPGVRRHPRRSQQRESLAQCVKLFCCQLEELLAWLSRLVATTASWLPAAAGAESTGAALHRCLEFRRDVASHRSLTERVLRRGEALLDCMAANSPALKDALGLIAKQSEELEGHLENLYESVLGAVDKDGLEDRAVQQTPPPEMLSLSDLAVVSHSWDG